MFVDKTIERETKFKELVESTWIQFPKIGLSCEKEISYHKFYCKIQTIISLKKLSEYLGIPIFESGPHTKYYLELNSPNNFGHYHPEFPKKLKAYLLPAKNNQTLYTITLPIYEHSIQNIAREFFIVYQKLDSNPKFFRKEADRYLMLVEENRLDPYYLDRFILFLYPAFTDNEDPEESSRFIYRKGDETIDAQVVKEIVGFWIRRKADGTDVEFIIGLVDLLKLYDPIFYQNRTVTTSN
ncbi:hypothetical protein ND861_02860 [Leptospira sp. 2 VSF19]|uniref:Uncharacterized protein n=1 Tax=Leptospira soteropolitanensis TaxID=2950025 RepID=A0AAW5VFH0_9LEPT|nr:hypothetical protein [Leptospira soteropolitanensis]MCW7491586.1 hypothetical protein [Leptospira soteropolitanensis]MCW7499170.1 hypothetical protein [Leptospira soteropolitanensis]MCW7521238.1 hypothetical protein [Leptospira soteropolitanensis]MCW7525274.1 hypothetical protein [Leptospira soteropolitanensis]MCW7529141.1 hypothetical protein [Leptospira soteropolitanensis]